jgi:hypothetical protein
MGRGQDKKSLQVNEQGKVWIAGENSLSRLFMSSAPTCVQLFLAD